jgi:hypothetical protein
VLLLDEFGGARRIASIMLGCCMKLENIAIFEGTEETNFVDVFIGVYLATGSRMVVLIFVGVGITK